MLEKEEYKNKVKIFLSNEERQVIYCVVLAREEETPDGGFWSRNLILDSAHNYMVNHKRLAYRHEKSLKLDEAVIVESYITLQDIPNEDPAQDVKEGSWIVGILLNDAYWKEYQDGTLKGLSAGGWVEPVKEVV